MRARESEPGNQKWEQSLRVAYETDYGWIEQGHPKFVVDLAIGERKLPSGPWDVRPCCAQRTKECLKTAIDASVCPKKVTRTDLLLVHPESYLQKIMGDRKELYDVFEIDVYKSEPLTADDIRDVLDPSLRSVGGVILSMALAFVYGRAVFAGDAMHHCSVDVGEGSSPFCCVFIAWIKLRNQLIHLGMKSPKALYIDVDVHHANGFAAARDELDAKEHFFMVDLFNESIWPVFGDAVKHVDIAKPFISRTRDRHYLSLLGEALGEAEEKLPKPDIIIYMAFNDVMDGDPLGMAKVSPKGILERDRLGKNLVFFFLK